jgi:CubicO group peptidase (beta-lactamase class C family)
MPRLYALLSGAGMLTGACAHSAPPTASVPAAAVTAAAASDSASGVYYPAPGDAWLRARPAAAGMDSAALATAVSYAQASEIDWSLDMKTQLAKNTARELYPDIVGPYRDRGRQNGIIIRHGYIVAEWGDTRRVDMTFSVAKSYLSTVAGLAFDRGLLKDLDEPVGKTVKDGGYGSAHNAPITWRMHLTQTSEWEGELWGKPDRADRRAGYDRALKAPGSFWEYNDVRVNRLALSLLRVWNRPLPEVLKRELMDPIGASSSWEWHGYRTSMTEQDGRRVESVTGGGHWGGGFWASTRDHARFGLLLLRRGHWKERQLLSERWVSLATSPAPIRPNYGFLWWLNTDRRQYPSASARAFFALGSGGNVIYMDPEHDVVAVVRWMATDKIDGFLKLVAGAIRK